MVYLGIKSLAKVSDDVIIVTSSLTKDMSGKEERYVQKLVQKGLKTLS